MFNKKLRLLAYALFPWLLLACSDGKTNSELKIYGGQEAHPRWVNAGALLHGGSSHCSLTLIHPRLAITASHCLDSFTDEDLPILEVSFAPVQQIGEPLSPDSYHKVESIGHRDFFGQTGSSLKFDIGYLVLKEPIEDLSLIHI